VPTLSSWWPVTVASNLSGAASAFGGGDGSHH
jgi:hypothetical protein